MKTRNGYPTKKDLTALFDRHEFIAMILSFEDRFSYQDYPGCNEKVKSIISELELQGFKCHHREPKSPCTGNVVFERKINQEK